VLQSAWSRCIAQPAREFGPSKLSVLSGNLPPGLRGTLYRNGPARLERGGIRVGHWFDGDGAVLAERYDGLARFDHAAARLPGMHMMAADRAERLELLRHGRSWLVFYF